MREYRIIWFNRMARATKFRAKDFKR